MTGLEALKEKLIEMGYQKNQVDSKIVPGVVAAIAENNELINIVATEKELEDAKRELENVKASIRYENQGLVRLKFERDKLNGIYEEYYEVRSADGIYKAISKKIADINKYIYEFNESLKKCETHEGRDAMRKAQVFAQSTEILNERNNTAYINGLAMILSNGCFPGDKKIKKIDYMKEEKDEDYD